MNKKLKDTSTFLALVIFMMMARTAIAEPRYIPSGSMLPGLEIQDRLVIEKVSSWVNTPQRGEILVFHAPFQGEPEGMLEHLAYWHGAGEFTPLIKRVIGLPGETIKISQGKVFINGKAMDESAYLEESAFYEFGPYTIPEGHVFMLGDNRNNSADSHIWGPLPIDHIMGKAVFRFWPLDRLGTPE